MDKGFQKGETENEYLKHLVARLVRRIEEQTPADRALIVESRKAILRP